MADKKYDREILLEEALRKIAIQKIDKMERAEELMIANDELKFQGIEKEKRAEELAIANEELVMQNIEKVKTTEELLIANQALEFQNIEKERKAQEYIIINKRLAFQKMQLEDFCNIISHNLRAPLVNISILVDCIAENEDPSEFPILRDQLKITTRILNEIFEELVESLQVKEDTEIKSKKINLRTYVSKVCSGLKGQINISNAKIDYDFDGSVIMLFPPKYMFSILHNLISNSLRFRSTERTPIIKIKTKRLGTSIILSVTDNGSGIDLKKHKNNLFKIRKVFHDHPDAKGFGLFITKSQIDAMNGEIWAESIPGIGSTFFVEFKNQLA